MDAKTKDRYRQIIRDLHSSGHPEYVRQAQKCLEEESKMPAEILRLFSDLKPSKADLDVELLNTAIPPKTGSGSNVAVWREFAQAVTDLDEEVVGRMSKADIVRFCENQGIIPK